MTEVAICKSVGTDLEPDNDGMHLRDGADEGMMDQVVHREACDEKGKGGVDAVGPSNGKPCCSEALSGLCAVRRILRMPFGTTKGTFGLVCGGKFDDISDEEMARNEQVENNTEKYVLPAIIMAAYTYKNSVFHEIFNDQS